VQTFQCSVKAADKRTHDVNQPSNKQIVERFMNTSSVYIWIDLREHALIKDESARVVRNVTFAPSECH